MKKTTTTNTNATANTTNNGKGKLNVGLWRTDSAAPLRAAIEKARDVELNRRAINEEAADALSELAARYPMIDGTSIISTSAYADERAYKEACEDYNFRRGQIERAKKATLKKQADAWKYLVIAPLFGTCGIYDAYAAYMSGDATADTYKAAVAQWVETCLLLPCDKDGKGAKMMVARIARAVGLRQTGSSVRFYDDKSTTIHSKTQFQGLLVGLVRDMMIESHAITADVHERPEKEKKTRKEATEPTVSELAELAELTARNKSTFIDDLADVLAADKKTA